VASITKIGTVAVTEDGKIRLDGKPSTLHEVVTRIRAAQMPTKRARLEAQLRNLS